MKLKLLSFAILVFVLFPNLALAQQNTTRFFFNYNQEQVTVAGTSIGLTSTILQPAGALRSEMVTLRVTCASSSPCNIRLRMDGTAATTITGIMFKENEILTIYGYQNLSQLRMIREGSNSATVQVLYYR